MEGAFADPYSVLTATPHEIIRFWMALTKSPKKERPRKSGVGEALIESLSEAVAWARGEIAPPGRESPKTTGRSKPTASELAADLMFEGPGDLSTNPRYMQGFGQSNRRGKSGS